MIFLSAANTLAEMQSRPEEHIVKANTHIIEKG